MTLAIKRWAFVWIQVTWHICLLKLGRSSKQSASSNFFFVFFSHSILYINCPISLSYNIDWFENMNIVASNDINEDILHSLNSQVNYDPKTKRFNRKI